MRTIMVFLSVLAMANVAVAEMTFIETSLPQGGSILGLRQTNPAALALPEAEFLAEFAKINNMANSDEAFRLIRPGNVKLPVVKEERPAELPVVSAPVPAPAPVEEVAVEKTEDLQPDPRDLEIARLKEEIMALKAELEKADQEKAKQVPASTTVSATEKLRAKTTLVVLGVTSVALGFAFLFSSAFLAIMWRKDYKQLVEKQEEIKDLEYELGVAKKNQVDPSAQTKIRQLEKLARRYKKHLGRFFYIWEHPGCHREETLFLWDDESPRNELYGSVLVPGINKPVPVAHLENVMRRRPDLLDEFQIKLPPEKIPAYLGEETKKAVDEFLRHLAEAPRTPTPALMAG